MKKIIICFSLITVSLFAQILPPPRLARHQLNFVDMVEWKTASILEKIYRSSFLKELAAGTLSKERFDYYNVQDNMYDWRYADILLRLAPRAKDPTLKAFLVVAAQHSTSEWRTPPPMERGQCRSCKAYSDFEWVSVEESFSGGLAAIAPCYLIYWKVANWLKTNSVPGNKYQNWINEYSTPHFEKHVLKMKETLNQVANQASAHDIQIMLENFVTSTDYELQFWDSAYRYVEAKNQ